MAKGAWRVERTNGCTCGSRRARGAVAGTIAAGSFLALRYAFHGDCLIPTYNALRLSLFATLPVAFIFGFVWLVSELVYPVVLMWGVSAVSKRRQAVLAGMAGYVAIGIAGWLLAPELPRYLDVSRQWVWIFWPVAMLIMSGNFSNVACGY